MKINWNRVGLATLAAASVLVSGCGGLNAEGTMTPAMFLLRAKPKVTPGLTQAAPAVATPPAGGDLASANL